MNQNNITSGGQIYLNTRQEYDVETTSSQIGSRKFRRWQHDNAKFTKRSTFYGDINIIEHQAQFDVFKSL